MLVRIYLTENFLDVLFDIGHITRNPHSHARKYFPIGTLPQFSSNRNICLEWLEKDYSLKKDYT